MNTREHYDSLLSKLETLPPVEIQELLYDFYMEGYYGGEETQAEIDAEKRVKLRDQFAMAAMTGFNKGMVDYGWGEDVLIGHAKQAYAIADAMLIARNSAE